MNPFGLSRRILLSILLCFGGHLFAQDEPPPPSGQEVRPPPVDLIYQSLDLKYSTENSNGAAQNVGGKGEDMSGTTSALKSEVLDLKAAGAEIKESATEIKISLQGEILFDFDKSNIRPAAESTLAQVAKMIQSYPNARTLIEGYTDSKGSDSYNAKLSDRRAASVKAWFAQHGLKASAMQTHGWGAAKPVAPNKHPDGSDDPEGRQKNRRVEITIKK
jgi:outer membrane protein OmpA-like peptidoglycan-associated protein